MFTRWLQQYQVSHPDKTKPWRRRGHLCILSVRFSLNQYKPFSGGSGWTLSHVCLARAALHARVHSGSF